ncbi:hypothetical protein EV189_1542 [Motilibacter rhizosphaerae]|uniref:Uncharacterized protein n=1 Tax=Motilibacter rhizosphaerae TaxID=598652 RepID=A0A4Q7NSL4_9ACTN|nr:hypothetical protein [Motilibacter rhizosphaerae]RZS89768.1 hypothetical protein EV189_1542 [Motilibacter rhizosphaerae]
MTWSYGRRPTLLALLVLALVAVGLLPTAPVSAAADTPTSYLAVSSLRYGTQLLTASPRLWSNAPFTVDISFADADGAVTDVAFSAPGGRSFVPGSYQQVGTASSPRGALSVSRPDGTACDGGDYTVREVHFAGDGTVDRFWAGFACGASAFGEVAVGRAVPSGPLVVPSGVAFPELAPHSTTPARAAVWVLGGTPTRAAVAGVDASDFTARSGPCDARACRVDTTFAPVASGVRSGSLDLGPGLPVVALAGYATPGDTSLALHSGGTSDWVGKGQDVRVDQASGGVGVFGGEGSTSLRFAATSSARDVDGSEVSVDGEIDAPPGARLHAGDYTGALREGYGRVSAPVLDVSMDSRACSHTRGDIHVAQLDYAPDGAIAHLSLTFTQWCDGAADALEGTLHVHVLAPWERDLPRGLPALPGWPTQQVVRPVQQPPQGTTSRASLGPTADTAPELLTAAEGLVQVGGTPDDLSVDAGFGSDLLSSLDATHRAVRHAIVEGRDTEADHCSRTSLDVRDLHQGTDGRVDRLWALLRNGCDAGAPAYAEVVFQEPTGSVPAIAPSGWAFGEAAVGSHVGRMQTFWLTGATRSPDWRVSGPALADFRLGDTGCDSRGCRVDVTFVPSAPGRRDARLDAGPGATAVPLTGDGATGDTSLTFHERHADGSPGPSFTFAPTATLAGGSAWGTTSFNVGWETDGAWSTGTLEPADGVPIGSAAPGGAGPGVGVSIGAPYPLCTASSSGRLQLQQFVEDVAAGVLLHLSAAGRTTCGDDTFDVVMHYRALPPGADPQDDEHPLPGWDAVPTDTSTTPPPTTGPPSPTPTPSAGGLPAATPGTSAPSSSPAAGAASTVPPPPSAAPALVAPPGSVVADTRAPVPLLVTDRLRHRLRVDLSSHYAGRTVAVRVQRHGRWAALGVVRLDRRGNATLRLPAVLPARGSALRIVLGRTVIASGRSG